MTAANAIPTLSAGSMTTDPLGINNLVVDGTTYDLISGPPSAVANLTQSPLCIGSVGRAATSSICPNIVTTVIKKGSRVSDV
jgi:hypothetical protein